MAYTLAQLINEYNSADAIMLSNVLMKKYGLLTAGTYYTANKQLAHTYTNYTTLPTAGVRSLADGVAASTVQGTTTTKNLTLFNANGAWDQAFVGNNLDAFYNVQAPLYYNAVAALAQKAFIYGTNATFGNAGYTGLGLHQYVTASGTNTQIGGGATASCTSIFAVRFSPYEDMDGAAIAVDPLTNGGMFYINDNWTDPVNVAAATGSFMGHVMHFNMNACMILPGSNNVAALRGIDAANQPTVAQINSMLDTVYADSSTVIFCNRYGASVLGVLGKDGNLQMAPNEFGYSNQIYTWNGVPIVITDTITNVQTTALYQDVS